MLTGVGTLLGMILTFFMIVFFVYAVISWFSPDPNNFLVRMLNEMTEPILRKVRPKIPPLGMLDLSVLVVFGLIVLADIVIADSLITYGRICLANYEPVTVGF